MPRCGEYTDAEAEGEGGTYYYELFCRKRVLAGVSRHRHRAPFSDWKVGVRPRTRDAVLYLLIVTPRCR
jgi:hypothetical protein